jgi:hypothetical protein
MSKRSPATEILPGLWIGDDSASHDQDFLQQKQISIMIECGPSGPGGPSGPSGPGAASQGRIGSTSSESQHLYMIFPETYHQRMFQKLSQTVHEMCRTIQTSLVSHNLLVFCTNGQQYSILLLMAYGLIITPLSWADLVSCFNSKLFGLDMRLLGDYKYFLEEYRLRARK